MVAGDAGAHASGRAGQHFDEEKGKKLWLFDSTLLNFKLMPRG